jgi:hypothetical protein
MVFPALQKVQRRLRCTEGSRKALAACFRQTRLPAACSYGEGRGVLAPLGLDALPRRAVIR